MHYQKLQCYWCENFDDECHIIRRSGKHVVKSTRVDLEKIVGERMSQRALRRTPDRKYQHFNNINSTLLEDFDLQDMFRWIDKHKKNIELSRRAR